MRQLVIIIVLFTCGIVSVAQQNGFKSLNIKIDNNNVQLYKQSHALLIGVSDYINNWPDLPGVKEDIDAVKTALEYHDFNVVVVGNPTKFQIDDAISNFIARYGQGIDNRLVFYFAGHGHTVNTSYGEKLGYIVPADAPNPNNNEASFQSKAIEMAQIEIYAKRIQSKHAIFLFDACFSGSLFAMTRAVPQVITYKTTEPIRQFITSGTENEQVPDKSIFRQQFVSALMSNEADGNNDGYLTGSELGEFIQTTVTNYSYNYQHPQYGKIRNPALDKGDFVFILSGDQATEATISKTEEPVVGEAVVIQTYGSIELTTEIEGKIYLDGKQIGEISANTKVPINKVTTGKHRLEITGKENWSRSITVYKDQTAQLIAKSNKPENKFELANSGAFTDTRDNENYKWVKIGSQIWMAENLNYKTAYDSWCYDEKESNCNTYGRLYNWDTAKKVCPDSWHLPTDEEWKELEMHLGMSIEESGKRRYRGTDEGGKLKETGLTHWNSPNKGSTNESGFSALPGGYRGRKGYYGIGNNASFWSSTEETNSNSVWFRALSSNISVVSRNYYPKDYYFSVRCIGDK